VALESLSFGNGTLQNEKKLFHQVTKEKFIDPKIFFVKW